MGSMAAWARGLLLAAPLVGISAWVVQGALHRSHGPTLAPAAAPVERSAVLRGLPAPDADLPGSRLEERVDGAAEALRAQGCRRLLHWRLEAPPADLEALVFQTTEGAHAAMEGDAGKDRTPGLGDEALVSDQFLYFRRGPVFVRLLLDPGAHAAPGSLNHQATKVDEALRQGARL
jgi:hypothetical protein